MSIILASQSPRRQELMRLFGKPFTVQVADIDETMDPQGDPAVQVAQVSARKARAVTREYDDVVVAADTIVVCDGNILGKPRDAAHAFSMLKMLSGRTHQVMTGMTVLYKDRVITHTEITDITFVELTDQQIESYIATKEPMDKAGAYAIQGGAALFASRMEGDYYNVVGLPVCRLGQILKSLEETL